MRPSDVVKNESVIGYAVVTRDGNMVEYELPDGVHVETFAVMCATVFGAAITAKMEMNLKPLERIIVESEDNDTILVVPKGEKHLIVVVVNDKTAVEEVQKVIMGADLP